MKQFFGIAWDLGYEEETALHEIESLYREALAAGLEMAVDGLKVDNTTLRWALKELGPTGTNAEAYVKAAVEHVIWCREQATTLKEPPCEPSSS